MRSDKEMETAAVQIHNWLVTLAYMGKSTLSHDRHDERIKLIVVSPTKTH